MKGRQDGRLSAFNERRLVRVNGGDFVEGLQYVHLYYVPVTLVEHLMRYIENGNINADVAKALHEVYIEVGGFPYVLAPNEKKLSFEELNEFWRNQLVAEYLEMHWQRIEPDLEVTKELR